VQRNWFSVIAASLVALACDHSVKDDSDRSDAQAPPEAGWQDGPRLAPEPTAQRLAIASYDNALGVTPPDTQQNCARRPPGALAAQCVMPGRNLLGQCAETNFCDPKPGERADGASICVSYEGRSDVVLGGQGRSLRLDYDVRLSDDSFSGYVERLVSDGSRCPARGVFNLDALNMTHLTFWVRLESSVADKPVEMEIALKTGPAPGRQTSVPMMGKRVLSEYWDRPCATWGDGWRKLCVPLGDLDVTEVPAEGGMVKGNLDLRDVWELNLGFSKERFSKLDRSLAGTVWIDQIAFEQRF